MTNDDAALISEMGPRVLDSLLEGLADAFKCERDKFGLALFICTDVDGEDNERVQVFGNMTQDSTAKVCESLVERHKAGASLHEPNHPH